ncbi:2-amino-4-hydroxy-6-hydroxymethyldihydropteridinediphosphokinase [Palleronia marisminoris]|uniref:2-amino-4-hydroxy-6-hydroxymethyldihydropteridine pyrophosphokinase n=1 Tax=Palleronia marisminoris TaxID=315423 RepID=A0A1Y5SU18_9RHOB|nr:2-amino-4-hydroxy-6-hydroxymethyldihydropteridine diphosphokinase [Palleronia marisminoris]SFG98488.1 2-amino-4-hydroxy-6-hydroxymethyldihydropteridinediphosphokinase [Palleronia marisminoris]SLN48081.1 2-amino-4-hydroxy-6-hydroxymethyldihydropteridinepyrophosphokinase [Palleronia marisminoris]
MRENSQEIDPGSTARQHILKDSRSATFLIAFGANLPGPAGTPQETLGAALNRLATDLPEPMSISRLYETPAYPPGSGPPFLNGCAAVQWAAGPETLLALLHDIEGAFGRTRAGRWEPRVIDLDLIAAGASVQPDPATQDAWRALPLARQRVLRPDRLVLPHPRLHDRAFVLVPLLDVAPDWRHPRTGRSVREMVDALDRDEKASIRPVA